MENLNFHKQKLYALIVAGVGFIAMFLPWWKVSLGGYGGFGGGYSINGMHEIGILAFLGFLGAGIVTFAMGDKTKPYEGQAKMITAACFGVAGLIALIQFLRQTKFTSFGLYLAILAGIAGAVIVYVLKPEQFDTNKPPVPPAPPKI
jgi:peptidoglycan/LPS O-acetylase OafA/YrhL